MITGWCLLGGGSRIVKVTSTLVPAMGVAYILISVIVMIINRAYLPVVFSKIISEAFDFKAILCICRISYDAGNQKRSVLQ